MRVGQLKKESIFAFATYYTKAVSSLNAEVTIDTVPIVQPNARSYQAVPRKRFLQGALE